MNELLNSRLNILKLDNKLDRLKNLNNNIKMISKFSEDIHSEMDLQIPMEVEIRCLCDGQNRDGVITVEDLERSLDSWVGLPILDFHDKSKKATEHKISDRKGFLGENPRIQNIDGKNWVVDDAFITDRYLAYLVYLSDKRGVPLEVSPEFAWNPIRPQLMTITDRGHLIGNKLTVKSAS